MSPYIKSLIHQEFLSQLHNAWLRENCPNLVDMSLQECLDGLGGMASVW